MKTKSIAEQHQQWCVHYQRKPGMPKREACAKGHIYDDVSHVATLGRAGCSLRLPCIRRHHDESERNGEPLCQCPDLEWPTWEASLEHQREWEVHMAKSRLAIEATRQIRIDQKGQDWAGTIECPVCKGTLNVRHAGCNGHVWGRCETKDCVSWME